jgi:hypothetical protein
VRLGTTAVKFQRTIQASTFNHSTDVRVHDLFSLRILLKTQHLITDENIIQRTHMKKFATSESDLFHKIMKLLNHITKIYSRFET